MDRPEHFNFVLLPVVHLISKTKGSETL